MNWSLPNCSNLTKLLYCEEDYTERQARLRHKENLKPEEIATLESESQEILKTWREAFDSEYKKWIDEGYDSEKHVPYPAPPGFVTKKKKEQQQKITNVRARVRRRLQQRESDFSKMEEIVERDSTPEQ